MGREQKQLSVANQMLIAMAAGIIVGIIMMLLKSFLINGGNEKIWSMIDWLLFADITAPGNATSIGLFYIIKTLFIAGLQFGIVPLVLTSISLSLCSLTDTAKLGRIAGKCLAGFLGFYVFGALIAVAASIVAIKTGFFSQTIAVSGTAEAVVEYSVANPLAILIKAVPANLFVVLTNNSSIVAVIFIAVVLGLCMNFMRDELQIVRTLVEDLSKITNKYLDFIVNKCGPVCIFCMLVYTFPVFGMEQITPLLHYMLVTFICLIFYLFIMYPLLVSAYCKVNPLKFLKKTFKVAMWAFATNSSAATFPLTRKTSVTELGCSEEVADFVLPMGMTINMNGTTIEHIIAVAFIATVAGYEVTPLAYLTIMLLAIGSSAGTPAVPNAGTVMLYATMTGAGFNSDVCILLYTLLLTLNKPIDMTVVSLNVVGDAATACVVSASENSLNRQLFES